VKPAAILAVILACALAAVTIIWVAPVVGLSNSACQQHPYTSGCR
jgi:hypothetical protein